MASSGSGSGAAAHMLADAPGDVTSTGGGEFVALGLNSGADARIIDDNALRCVRPTRGGEARAVGSKVGADAHMLADKPLEETW